MVRLPASNGKNRAAWKIVAAKSSPRCRPVCRWQVSRYAATVRLSESAAVFTVSETVTNRNKLGRIYNMVQHATIGPPFLDETTVVDSNAERGFMQSSPLPNPEQLEIRWPQAHEGRKACRSAKTNDITPTRT